MRCPGGGQSPRRSPSPPTPTPNIKWGHTCRIISMHDLVLALPAAVAPAMEISRGHLPVRSAASPAPPPPHLRLIVPPHPYLHCGIAFPAVDDRGGSPCGVMQREIPLVHGFPAGRHRRRDSSSPANPSLRTSCVGRPSSARIWSIGIDRLWYGSGGQHR